jgi:hypothetical protein
MKLGGVGVAVVVCQVVVAALTLPWTAVTSRPCRDARDRRHAAARCR